MREGERERKKETKKNRKKERKREIEREIKLERAERERQRNIVRKKGRERKRGREKERERSSKASHHSILDGGIFLLQATYASHIYLKADDGLHREGRNRIQIHLNLMDGSELLINQALLDIFNLTV